MGDEELAGVTQSWAARFEVGEKVALRVDNQKVGVVIQVIPQGRTAARPVGHRRKHRRRQANAAPSAIPTGMAVCCAIVRSRGQRGGLGAGQGGKSDN